MNDKNTTEENKVNDDQTQTPQDWNAFRSPWTGMRQQEDRFIDFMNTITNPNH